MRGNGALVKMTKTKGEPVTPGTVNVGNWGEGAEAFARVFEAVNAKAAQGRPTVKAAKRSWTQPDLDKAIWEYKAKRAPRYQDLVQAVKRGDRGARASARKLFGRNAIARELGVRSPSMVSNSAAWLEIARELQLPLARDRAKGTRRTRRSGKIGEEIGFEQQAVADAPESDPATPLLRAEREETLRMIRSLPNDQAGPILSKYDAGVITDEQARGQVKTLLNQA